MGLAKSKSIRPSRLHNAVPLGLQRCEDIVLRGAPLCCAIGALLQQPLVFMLGLASHL